MGEIVLAWVDCKNCDKYFPVVAKSEYKNGIENLKEVPRFCPFCGSENLEFGELCTEYYG